MNFLFLTALKAEANPLIESYGLINDPDTHLYTGENISLMVTGVGKPKTESRIQSLFSQYSDFKDTVVINIGIAGGNPNETNVGELYRVNAIYDEDTGQSFFPDILLKHSLIELSLVTVSKGITENRDIYRGLVDMEGSAIFQLLSKQVPPHRLVFLKVVSDHMDVSDWKTLDVTGLIAGHVDTIRSIIVGFEFGDLSDRIILSEEEMDFLNLGMVRLKLTETQQVQLLDYSENYKKRSGDGLEFLNPFFTKAPKSKQERNMIFEQIRQSLSA